jgi:hypothetical protein
MFHVLSRRRKEKKGEGREIAKCFARSSYVFKKYQY